MKDYKDLKELDLKLRMLSGSAIKVENLEVKPYTLEEINEYGYSDYMNNLQWILISIDDFINSVLDIEKRVVLEQQRDNLKTFDFYVKLGGQEMLEGLLTAMAMIFKTDDVRILEEKGVIAINFVKMGVFIFDEDGEMTVDENVLESLDEEEIMLIHRDNFDDLVEVVKFQNYLTKPSQKKDNVPNPADEETRKLQEHMDLMKRKIEGKKKKQQKNDGEDGEIDISDIISAVSSKSYSINKLNVWQLTLYQLYDEYARLELIDNYDFSIRAMMAGAEKIDLKHWSSRL